MKDNKKKNLFDWDDSDTNNILMDDWDISLPSLNSPSPTSKSIVSKQRSTTASSTETAISPSTIYESNQNVSFASQFKSNIKESTFKRLSDNLKIMTSPNSNGDAWFMKSKMKVVKPAMTSSVKKLNDKTVSSSSETDLSVYLMQTKFYDLYDVKELENKRKLLEAASLTHSFKLLITVMQHLRCTLQPPLFVSILKSVPRAWHNFMFFVNKTNIELSQNEIESFECVNTYMLDFIISKFVTLLCQNDVKDLDEKTEHLIKISEKNAYLNTVNQQMRDFMLLFALQKSTKSKQDEMIVNMKSFLSEKECEIAFKIFIKQNFMDSMCSIVSQDVCRSSSYEANKSLHKISDKQFEWILVRVFVKLKKWEMLRSVFVSKFNLFKAGKCSSLVGFELVLNHLHSTPGVPAEEIRYYFKNVPETLKPFLKDILKLPY